MSTELCTILCACVVFLSLTFMSSSRACGFSIPSGMHFLFSGSDSSFSTSVLSPLSSNSVKCVHLLWDSEAGESEGVWGKSREVEPGLQLSSESTDKTALRCWPLRLSGEQGPSWVTLSGFSPWSSLTWVSHESSFMSWLLESEEGLSVFIFASLSEGTKWEKESCNMSVHIVLSLYRKSTMTCRNIWQEQRMTHSLIKHGTKTACMTRLIVNTAGNP